LPGLRMWGLEKLQTWRSWMRLDLRAALYYVLLDMHMLMHHPIINGRGCTADAQNLRSAHWTIMMWAHRTFTCWQIQIQRQAGNNFIGSYSSWRYTATESGDFWHLMASFGNLWHPLLLPFAAWFQTVR
jgi:hypothetical protein